MRAILRRRSLLAAGITGLDGDFEAGDVVDLVDSADVPVEHRREVVHADDLVPLRR
ncbi:PUA domain-containing protein [Amycolatopsis nivea]|uniref:PUA domain-containing protein n=1 Tax=Amycolatopsis nivea TaxID=1644109 RepID=UPI003F6D9825